MPLTQFFKLNFGERLSTTSSAYSDDFFFEDEPSQIGQPKINSAMEFLMAATPKDLKCVALEKLLEAGEFDEYGEAVKATAFLLSKDIKDGFFIKLRFPKYPIADFKKLSARVYQIPSSPSESRGYFTIFCAENFPQRSTTSWDSLIFSEAIERVPRLESQRAPSGSHFDVNSPK